MNSAKKPLSIIDGDRVYVVEPFPMKEVHRIYSWMKAFKTVIQTDYSPKNKQEFINEFKAAYNNVRSFAVIDKNNELIGSIIFEPQGATNGFLHVASRRSAFGSRMIDEAGEIVIEELFQSNSTLTRVSGVLHHTNNMAASLARRLGFKKEGKLEDFIVQKGEPKAVVWYGLTRKDWNKQQQEKQELCHSSEQQQDLSSDSGADSLAPLSEEVETKVDSPTSEQPTEQDSQPDNEPIPVEVS